MNTRDELSTLDVYDRWAGSYPPFPHNPLMRAEQRAMLELWPEIAGRRTLDLACGSGRYAKLLAEGGAAEVTALDFSSEMLRQVPVGNRVRASMMRLPFASGAFDVVVSGLAVGHATDLDEWLVEAARVLTAGGVLLYSDFHPEAVRSGQTRSFKDSQGGTHTVPHHCHSIAAQRRAATAARLTIDAVREVRAGVELRESFPGSEDFYRRWDGLPMVLVVRARK